MLVQCDVTTIQDGVTHTNANDKERVMLRWIAPAAGTGPVQIGSVRR